MAGSRGRTTTPKPKGAARATPKGAVGAKAAPAAAAAAAPTGAAPESPRRRGAEAQGSLAKKPWPLRRRFKSGLVGCWLGCRPCCCSACGIFWWKLWLYMTYCGWAAGDGWWQRLHQYNVSCAHEPLPVNQSGVKVMIAGFAKMGTRTLSRTLFELGYEHSYHGEEFLLNVWHQLTHDYWIKPENGGRVVPPIGTVLSSSIRTEDVQVLNNTPPELLARRISACRTDAVAFDGAEALFWPVYNVSPTTKVLVLNWRTFEEASESMENFGILFIPWITLVSHADVGVHALPWGVLFLLSEPLLGWPIKRFLEEGKPLINQFQSPYMILWLRIVGGVRYAGHWFLGLCEWIHMTKEKHTAFFEEVYRRTPPERRMEVDPRKTTYDDLCEFLELRPCRKTGRIPRAINLGNHEFDFFPGWCMCAPFWLLIHWLNWQFFRWALGHLLPHWKRFWAAYVVVEVR